VKFDPKKILHKKYYIRNILHNYATPVPHFVSYVNQASALGHQCMYGRDVAVPCCPVQWAPSILHLKSKQHMVKGIHNHQMELETAYVYHCGRRYL